MSVIFLDNNFLLETLLERQGGWTFVIAKKRVKVSWPWSTKGKNKLKVTNYQLIDTFFFGQARGKWKFLAGDQTWTDAMTMLNPYLAVTQRNS